MGAWGSGDVGGAETLSPRRFSIYLTFTITTDGSPFLVRRNRPSGSVATPSTI